MIKDIELGDYYHKQWNISSSSINLLNQKITLKDSIILGYQTQQGYYKQIIDNDGKIGKQKDIVITGYQSDIKKLKFKNTLVKFISGSLIAGLGYLYIIK